MNPEELMNQEEMSDDDVLVHMATDEIEELSRLQPSGIVRDNPWKIPEFHELNDLIMENPELKEKIQGAFHNYITSSHAEKNEIQNLDEEKNDQTFGTEEDLLNSQYGEDPEAQAMGNMGTNGDTQIALMPKNLFEFFWDSVPEEYRDVNPETGFPQFGFWSGLLGVVGSVVGSVVPGLGTQLGGLIGGGLGSIGESVFSGNPSAPAPSAEDDDYDFDDEEYGNSPSLGEGILNMANEYLPELLGKKTQTQPDEEGIKEKVGSKYNITPKGEESSKPKSGLEKAYDIATRAFGLDDASQQKKSLDTRNRKDRSNYNKYQSKLKEASVEQRQHNTGLYDRYMDRFHPSSGYESSDKFVTAPQNKKMINLARPFNQHKEGGEVIRHLNPIKGSRYIDGDEGGQEDNIYVDVIEHSYVIDATSVSQVGDGSSNNGAKKLEEYFDKIPSIKIKNKKMVPCALSAGEYVISAEKVAGLGGGDIQKGVKMLKSFVEKLRKYKSLDVKKIPKPTKDLSFYIKQNKTAVGG